MESPRITVEEAKRKVDSGERVVFIDTRNPQAWAESEQRIPGAIRVPLAEADQSIGELPRDATIITYCT